MIYRYLKVHRRGITFIKIQESVTKYFPNWKTIHTVGYDGEYRTEREALDIVNTFIQKEKALGYGEIIE